MISKTLTFTVCFFANLLLNAQSDLNTEITKMAGTYTGEWISYRYVDGNLEMAMSWQDTVVTGVPIINGTMAYFNVKNKMSFDYPKMSPYQLTFQEGFELSDDNQLKHFIKYSGVKSYFEKVDKDTYVVSQPVNDFELGLLGFKSAKSAHNNTLKTVLVVNGKVTHQVIRISTVVIEGKDGDQVIQFVSLKGYHIKTK